ncbi:YbdK family carboxylate-amine ligase [Rathayibacter sp. YIM 133350]|uniref:carboxylate-amine ligase n=1 Tax=Rathayibacter sp. YIM 133350 TaxID=3131992 RepID=UPI00307E605A
MQTAQMPSFGVEEEFMLLDSRTLRPVDVPEAVFAALRTRWSGLVKHEFLTAQVEHASVVFARLSDAPENLGRFRADLAEHADRLGVVVGSVGVPFDMPQRPAIAAGERYASVVRDFGAIIGDHQLNGLHVHVGIPSRQEGVRVLGLMRPWLPLLVAFSANSPFARGADTGFASWRTILMRRWTTHGCPPYFTDADDYDRRVHALVGIGGTNDMGLIAWNLRLSEHLPTIEFRMADAQLEAGDSVLVAALCRALVARALAHPHARAESVGSELLEAAVWAAARDGLRARLPHPETGASTDATALLRELLPALEPWFGAESALVEVLGERMLSDGTGADRQRRAYTSGGRAAMRRLLQASTARTLTSAAEV